MVKILSEEHKRKIGLAHKGRKRSKETKDKIRKKLTGHSVSKETRDKISKINKGHTAWNKGIGWSDEAKKRISDTCKRKGIEPSVKFIGFGSNHPLWKGGVTPENKRIRQSLEYKIWRKSVFSRDNFICQCCEKSGGKLHAHHINNFSDFPELRMIVENGISLCKECHLSFHKKYGGKNNTKDQLIEFIEQHGR